MVLVFYRYFGEGGYGFRGLEVAVWLWGTKQTENTRSHLCVAPLYTKPPSPRVDFKRTPTLIVVHGIFQIRLNGLLYCFSLFILFNIIFILIYCIYLFYSTIICIDLFGLVFWFV